MVATTTALGMTRHDMMMNTNQMFSHFQRGITFIGAVKSPLHIPETTAKETPSPTMLQLPSNAPLVLCWTLHAEVKTASSNHLGPPAVCLSWSSQYRHLSQRANYRTGFNENRC